MLLWYFSKVLPETDSKYNFSYISHFLLHQKTANETAIHFYLYFNGL